MDRIAEPDALQREFSSLVPDIILASSSPNRKKLLEAGGTHVSVYVPEIDEERIGATPDDIVMSIARRKIEAYLASPAFDGSRLAVAADTLVLIGGQLLGKPGGDGEAAAMLSAGSLLKKKPGCPRSMPIIQSFEAGLTRSRRALASALSGEVPSLRTASFFSISKRASAFGLSRMM